LENKNWNETWATLVERSWADPLLREDLKDNPNRVLAAHGLSIPEGVNFVVVENEPNRLHLVLPSRPGEELKRGEDAEAVLSHYNAAVIF
jgi:hypothetical protein